MRNDRNIKEKRHDPYDVGRKYSEGTYCPQCQANYWGGRWVWPEKTHSKTTICLCPACRRKRDDFPAGEVYLSGTYLSRHRTEILNLIRNIIDEGRERTPLKRLITLKRDRDNLCIRLTDNHLARHIGDALYKAYKGELQLKYSDEEKFVRLYWHRDV
ncbi:MAG: ATP-binding protein [Deltaproteobacteria bacterium]|nr:ATP-binding protein [Deltaproteobacteria bacterium]